VPDSSYAFLYSLCYRIGNSFQGVVLVEADSPPAALLPAELEQLYPGGECDGHALSPGDARVIPGKFIGRLLDESEFADLERILVANVRKKLAVPSVRRPSRLPKGI